MRFLLILALFYIYSHADRDGGPYIGVGAGYSKVNVDGLYNTLKKDTSGSATFYGGAYINKYLSVELSYASFDAWHVKKGYEIDDKSTLNFGALGVSTLAHYPFFDDSLDLYGRFGVAQMSLGGASALGFSYLVGAGMSYRLNDYVALKVAYDLYSFDYDKDGDEVADKSMQIEFIYSAIEVQF